MVQQQILDKNGWKDKKAWAFGLGLERLAMVKFAINDIRTFWSEDERFTKQFKRGNLDTKFKPYSKYPPCYKVGSWTKATSLFIACKLYITGCSSNQARKQQHQLV